MCSAANENTFTVVTDEQQIPSTQSRVAQVSPHSNCGAHRDLRNVSM